MDLKSGSPALSVKTFDDLGASADPMTLSGTINKTALLFGILLVGAGWVWDLYFASHSLDDILAYLWAGTLGGFIVALVTIFNKRASPFTAPLYSLLEGFAIGGVVRPLRIQAPRHRPASGRSYHGHPPVYAGRLPLPDHQRHREF